MTLTLATTNDNTIALPAWLIQALKLSDGAEVEALIEENVLHVARPDSVLPVNGAVHPPEVSNETDQADEEELFSLEETVARIKALPPNPNAIEHATKTVDELVADLAANPPSADLLTFAQFYPRWVQLEAELKAMEAADDIREGRV